MVLIASGRIFIGRGATRNSSNSDRAQRRPSGEAAQAAAAPAVTGGDRAVLDHLAQNPDFFTRHPDALKALDLPSDHDGPGVIDFQQAQSARLRSDLVGGAGGH